MSARARSDTPVAEGWKNTPVGRPAQKLARSPSLVESADKPAIAGPRPIAPWNIPTSPGEHAALEGEFAERSPGSGFE
ncbi:hypothetical protein [Embleya hyalina]|uniref:hypothetical protein n=1 Tax=Embleya hyalina TaxID=516124 RepID=UPI000F840DED|nr:hypothetical protein [Embleya hyalina]